ncbi:related to Som1 protein [Cephalotrichum gorgonifer]|uniref:Related to Som1 protein n=1 Tax=Cephalotrichum gorgonifer TaxID=2041049 RepID=A0AAE8ST03_9PEZI|nr:related to Som1 protein [Cephalotrichum gorgonifer]
MANLGNMGGGPVGGAAPMPLMNNAAAPQQPGAGPRPPNENNRTLLNTYIYEYFIRFGMNDCARTLLQGDHQVHVLRDGANRRRDENGNVIGNGAGGEAMDTDSKDDMDGKLPDDLPQPKLPKTSENTSFLHEWFCLFWDMYSAQRKNGGTPVHQYVNHTLNQSRLRQSQQQELLRQMRPDVNPQYQQMMRMQNGGMGMAGKQGLARAAMANNQNHPPGAQMMQQGKQNQMQRDPSDLDGNRQRPGSPGSVDNAPSPSKRPRLGDSAFNPNQPGMRPVQMPGQVMNGGNMQQAHQLLMQNGINPNNLSQAQLQQFSQQSPAVQAKSISTYSTNLQHQQSQQMPNRQMANSGIPQGQGSPMMQPGPDGAAIGAYYNPEMGGGPGAMRGVPGGAQPGTGSNHALQDYQLQLMLLEQQNKKRLMMARQEQDNMGGIPRDGPNGAGGPAPQGPNGQMMADGSPQGARSGASPSPAEQMKRGTPQMGNNMGSPHPDGAQSRGSPNAMNFMGGEINPTSAPHFFKDMNGNMVGNGQMNAMRPPNAHGNQQFNGPVNPQMMAGRGQQGAVNNPGNAQIQWQGQGNQMAQQGQGQQVQGTPQQRNSMPPPSGPVAATANASNRTSSPQQSAGQGTPQPPTPSQVTKPAPKKKESKSAKNKSAAQKKNAAAAAAAVAPTEPAQEAEPPTPATPMTPGNGSGFKASQAGSAANATAATVSGPNGPQATAAPASAPAPAPPTQSHPDPTQNNFGMDNGGAMVDFSNMDFANPLTSDDVLTDFNFDAFLHEDGDNGAFDFGTSYGGMDATGEIGAE